MPAVLGSAGAGGGASCAGALTTGRGAVTGGAETTVSWRAFALGADGSTREGIFGATTTGCAGLFVGFAVPATRVSRGVVGDLPCLVGGGGAGCCCFEVAFVIAVDGGVTVAAGCSVAADVIGAVPPVSPSSPERLRVERDHAAAINATAASAPAPMSAFFLIRTCELFLACSSAVATDALNETDAGYEGPLNFARTVDKSFAISIALEYRPDGSLAIAFITMRSSAGGRPGMSSLMGRGFSVMILKKRF